MTSRKRVSEILVDNRQMSRENAAQIFALMQAGRTGKSEQELILEREFATEKEIAKFQKGNLFDWGKEVAIVSFPMREYQADDEVDEIEYRNKYQQTGELLLTKAGYRLAKVLNNILK